MKEYIVNPVVVRADASKDASIYEAIVAMGMRARQINDDVKTQLQARMVNISPLDDDSEFGNFDQMEISKEFDKIPKPTFLAMKEMLEKDLHYKSQRLEDDKPSSRRKKRA